MTAKPKPVFDDGGRRLAEVGWCIYAVVGEATEEMFFVKIGVSVQVYQRYRAMLTGVPFKNILLWCPVGKRSLTYKLEKAIHRQLEDHHTRGEWFAFHMAEKDVFHQTMRDMYHQYTGHDLEWNKVTEAQLLEFERHAKSKKGKVEKGEASIW